MKHASAILAAATALALSASPAIARDDNPRAAREAARSQGADAQDPDREICVRATITGSRIPRRICRTARQWEEEEGGIPVR